MMQRTKRHGRGRRRPAGASPLLRGVLLLMFPFLFAGVAGAQDTISPRPPQLQYVTVEPPTGDVSLSWSPSPDADVAGYIIYRNTRGIWVAVDTLRDPDATGYRDRTAHANLFAEGYVVAAYDSALNLSPLSAGHTTNLLQAAFDSCAATIPLVWSGYRGWDDALAAYTVLMSVDGSPYRPFDTLPPTTLTDTLRQAGAGRTYCFIVEAHHRNGWSSRSNRRCVVTTMSPPPSYVLCGTMAVADNRTVTLTFLTDPAAGAATYVLTRGTHPDILPDTVARITTSGETLLTFTDTPGDTLSRTLYYRLLIFNGCGREMIRSRPFTLLVPQVLPDDNANLIRWTHPLSYDTLLSLQIFRSTALSGMTLLAELSPADTLYRDDITGLLYQPGNTGDYCYQVVAAAPPHAGEERHSASYAPCLHREAEVWLPNAFTPNGDGRNDLFAPVFNHLPEEYHLVITDRWGRTLFESTDPSEKWDGTDTQGNPVPAGTYVVHLSAVSPSGKTLRRTATVTVIIPH